MTRTQNRNHQILVVDDEEGLLNLQQDYLEAAGFMCFTASSGRAALQVLAGEAIDLVVIDVLMPGMSGLELFQQVKAKFPWTAVLFVTGVNEMDVAVSQVKDGAFDYLIKPVNRSRLIESVKKALESQSEYLESSSHQRHLEELLVHQSKALENKVREVQALNRMIVELPEVRAMPQGGVHISKQHQASPGAS